MKITMLLKTMCCNHEVQYKDIQEVQKNTGTKILNFYIKPGILIFFFF